MKAYTEAESYAYNAGAAKAGKEIARLRSALREIVDAAAKAKDRMEAWYDTAKGLARRLPDSQATAWSNQADNYGALINPLRSALLRAESALLAIDKVRP